MTPAAPRCARRWGVCDSFGSAGPTRKNGQEICCASSLILYKHDRGAQIPRTFSIMNTQTLLTSVILLAGTAASRATLAMWQSEVTAVGTAPATTNFTTIPGGSPILFNVGALTGDRSFEFIVNSPSGGISQALMGSQDPAVGRQGLKFDQCCNTGLYGMTNFGVIDYNSSSATDFGRDVHIVFTSNGSNTDMFTDGIYRFTYPTALIMQGVHGLGAADSFGTFFDVMAGNILGFASYDSALTPAEVLQHNNSFTAIPEPTGSLLAGLTALGMIIRRRR